MFCCVYVYESVLNLHSMRGVSVSCVVSVSYRFDIFSSSKELQFQSNNGSTPVSLSRELYRILVVVLVLFMNFNRAGFAISGLRGDRMR